jgi:RNA polymerase sigma-70 factor (ECF subfamily)
VRGLRTAIADRPQVAEADLHDFAQDALLKILAGSDSFQGESRFTTWAQKIAVRVAFTELRPVGGCSPPSGSPLDMRSAWTRSSSP